MPLEPATNRRNIPWPVVIASQRPWVRIGYGLDHTPCPLVQIVRPLMV